MRRMVTAWLKHQVDIDHEREGGVARFSLRIAGKAVALASVINVTMHCALDQAGLLPYPLAPALVIGLAATVAITFVVSFIFALVIGQVVRQLAVQRDTFEHLSSTDALSGVRNRRAFFEHFEGAPEAGQLILIDVDRFKTINDTYGHLAGDEVIRGVGQTLRAIFAGTPAAIGRIGGEEFAVFLPDTAGSRPDLAEAARAAVAAMVVAGIERPVTISLGVAATEPPRPAIEVYSAADRALYLAKAGGRNRIVREDEICVLPRLQEATTAAVWPTADRCIDAA